MCLGDLCDHVINEHKNMAFDYEIKHSYKLQEFMRDWIMAMALVWIC